MSKLPYLIRRKGIWYLRISTTAVQVAGKTFRAVKDEYLRDPRKEMSESTIKNYTIILDN